ncbi:hypothetical protein HDU90_005165 [Geranomyces variabilis]|nr:hypothetical protein HDU90_005165 [Geranomyces variabilis]
MNKDSLPPTRQRKTPAERRPWQPEEDKLLLELVEKESRGDEPTMWKRVAESIPGRNNKNCRKRWHSTLKCKNNGTWAPDEDERLINAVKTHGTLWVKVAKHVGTRISDQCAKRWTDYLDPSLTHEEWLAEEDSLLLKAVETHGRSWTLIVQSCLKGRAAISAKNRYGKLMRDIEKANTKNRGKGNAARAKRSARAMETVTELEDFGVATSLPPEPMSVDINLGDPLKKRQRTCSASSSPSTVATTADSAFSASSTTGSVGYSPIVDTGFQDFLNRPLPQFPAADPASMDIDDFFFLHGSKIGLAPLPASPILGDMDGFDSFDPFCVTDSPAPLAQTYLSSALDPVAVPSSYDEFGFLSSEMFGDVLSTAAWAEPGSNVHEHTAFLETFLTEQGLPRASQSMLGDELFHMEPAAFPIPPQPPSPAPAVVKDPASVKFLRTTPMRPFQPVGSIPPAPKLPNGGVTTPQAQVICSPPTMWLRRRLVMTWGFRSQPSVRFKPYGLS